MTSWDADTLLIIINSSYLHLPAFWDVSFETYLPLSFLLSFFYVLLPGSSTYLQPSESISFKDFLWTLDAFLLTFRTIEHSEELHFDLHIEKRIGVVDLWVPFYILLVKSTTKIKQYFNSKWFHNIKCIIYPRWAVLASFGSRTLLSLFMLNC